MQIKSFGAGQIVWESGEAQLESSKLSENFPEKFKTQ
jgi:hypothetical protein